MIESAIVALDDLRAPAIVKANAAGNADERIAEIAGYRF
jgi:hypothetical protein